MKTKILDNIPKELLFLNYNHEDVSIIIGENGCGKSTLLGYLADFHCRMNKDVVGIANTIHDKFNVKKHNFYSLRGRRGRRITRDTIKNSFIKISRDNEQGLRNAARTLRYVGFDPMIGFGVKRINPEFEIILQESDLKHKLDVSILISLLNKFNNLKKHSEITWLNMSSNSFEFANLYSLAKLIPYESLLINLDIIPGFDFYLSKNNNHIPLMQASSGELTLITSIVFLSTIIKEENTIILIDEPENSLHPKWQKEYVATLMDIFYLYQPKIVIATHSPLIVSGAKINLKNLAIYKAHNFKFERQEDKSKNIEEEYYNLFEITTPENRFLSNLLVRYLNQLAKKDLSIHLFMNIISDIEGSIYDPMQRKVIKRVREIANEIDNY